MILLGANGEGGFSPKLFPLDHELTLVLFYVFLEEFAG